jgi:vacuolar-type H+-ATPase subunit I/STV1
MFFRESGFNGYLVSFKTKYIKKESINKIEIKIKIQFEDDFLKDLFGENPIMNALKKDVSFDSMSIFSGQDYKINLNIDEVSFPASLKAMKVSRFDENKRDYLLTILKDVDSNDELLINICGQCDDEGKEIESRIKFAKEL